MTSFTRDQMRAAMPHIRGISKALGMERRQVIEALEAHASIPVAEHRQLPALVLQQPVNESVVGFKPCPKPVPVRSPAYLAAVRSLACKRCSVIGFSQAAHPNEGKGMGTKAGDNKAFPLCGYRPGIAGCHHEHDQGGNVSRDDRRALERTWGRQTFDQLLREGRVPRGMPAPVWEE